MEDSNEVRNLFCCNLQPSTQPLWLLQNVVSMSRAVMRWL